MNPSPQQPETIPTIIIQPTTGWVSLRLQELVEYRDLLFFLVWRDIQVRYKQTVLGVAWALIQPLLAMLIFSVFFGRLAKIPSDGVPYPIFAYCGLLPWQLFSHALTESGNSLVANERLITKVYFPRLVIPLSAVLAGLVDFMIASLLLIGMMISFHVMPTAAVWTAPFFVVLAVTTALAAGLWLSALNVRYRDIRYTIPFLAQFLLFATPVVYPSSLLPHRWQSVYGLNPMAGVVEGFRWAMLGTQLSWGLVATSVASTLVLLIGGLFYFRRTERTFADLI